MIVYEKGGKQYLLLANTRPRRDEDHAPTRIDKQNLTEAVGGGGTAGLPYDTIAEPRRTSSSSTSWAPARPPPGEGRQRPQPASGRLAVAVDSIVAKAPTKSRVMRCRKLQISGATPTLAWAWPGFDMTLLAFFRSRLSAPSPPTPIRLISKDGTAVAIEARGLPAGIAELPTDDAFWARVLSVYVGKEGGDKSPLAGTYTVRGNPRLYAQFSAQAGLSYLAVFYPPAPSPLFAPRMMQKLRPAIPAKERGEPAKVVAIYPSAATLPENQLRFYLHFSAPMSRGEVYEHLKLLKADGTAVELPFLEIGEELWDTSGKRLTLLIDPGRIKRGLKPREENGPVLEAGGKYTLVIDKAFHDAEGRPLAESFEKTFTAAAPVEAAIDPKDWKIALPAAGSREPLAIKFPRPLDRCWPSGRLRSSDQRASRSPGR